MFDLKVVLFFSGLVAIPWLIAIAIVVLLGLTPEGVIFGILGACFSFVFAGWLMSIIYEEEDFDPYKE